MDEVCVRAHACVVNITPLDVLRTYQFFSYQTAIAAGLTSADLKRALRAGLITRLKKGWYTAQVLRYPIERHRLLTKIEVADHSGSVASHYSALSLLEIPVIDVPLSVVNIMLDRPRYGRHRRSVTIHNPYPDAGTKVPGLEAVSTALAIVQTATVSPVAGLAAGDHAVRHGLTTASEIHVCLDALGGRDHCATAAVALSLIDPLRESPGESKMTYVTHLMGYHVEPQFRIMTRNGERFADGRITGTRVLLEHDGREKYADDTTHSAQPDPLVREKLREDDIRDEEWEIVRVTKESFDDLPELRKRIERAVARAEQHFGPSRDERAA